MSYLGIDKGGTRHTFALADEQGTVLRRCEHATDRHAGAQAELESLRRETALLVEYASAAGSGVRAIGISFGGPVDAASGTTLLSHHVAGWEGVSLRRLFQDWFHVPTLVDNDANAGALGEWRFGAGVGCGDMVYVNVGTGIGGGVIANGQLVRGERNLAGEIGHMTIDLLGPVCTCGRRGCLESFASGPSIERRFQERYAGPEAEKVTCREIFQRARAGEAGAAGIVAESAEYLARGFGAAICLVNPARAILGGGLSEAGAGFVEQINQNLPKYVLPQALGVRVVPALLGHDAGVRGALVLAMDAPG